MGVKGHDGGEQVGGELVEAKAEAGVRMMEALREARMGEAVRVLKEVVLLGC